MHGFLRSRKSIHSKSQKVCGTAFSVKKIAEKCVNPGVIFGPIGIILGHSRAILGHIWAILGHFWPFLGHFVAFLDKFAENSNFFAG